MSMFRATSPTFCFASTALLLTVTGCADPSGPADADGGATALSVSFAVAAVDTNRVGNAIVTGTASDTIVLTKVLLVLDEVQLKRAGVTTCPDSIVVSASRGRSSDDRGCSRLDLGPMLVDLPLSGAATSALAVSVPAGSYREFEFELDDVRTGANATPADRNFLTAHPEFRNVSVRVAGTYKGSAFTFLSRASAEVEFEFEPSLTVQAGVNDNVSIAIDLSKWFTDASGALLSPSLVNQTRIDQNIIQSFSAFGDRDRNGREDRGRGRGRGRGRSNDD